jgi:Zn-dependent protease with chaperone function
MKLKPWQKQVLHDRLVEIGPSQGDTDLRKFTYLEFQKAGRVRNAVVMADLEAKLSQMLGVDNGTFYLSHGENSHTRDSTSVLLAISGADGATYALDMASRGIERTLRQMKRVITVSRLVQYFGALVFLVGIPMLLVIVGIFLIMVGGVLWFVGKKMAAAYQSNLELLEQQASITSEIPGVRLV